MRKDEEPEFELEEDEVDSVADEGRLKGAKHVRKVKKAVKSHEESNKSTLGKKLKKKVERRSDPEEPAEKSIGAVPKKRKMLKREGIESEADEEGNKKNKRSAGKKNKRIEDEGPTDEEDAPPSKDDNDEGEEELFEEEIFEEEPPEKPKIAKKMALEDGVKRRLLRDSREIKKLKDQLKEMRSDIQGFENEIEYVEKEMEKVRSEKEGMDEEMNKRSAIINALEKKLNRTQKDFDGYKGRINQEIDRKAIMKMKGMVLGVIEILDNFDRAINEGRKLGGGREIDKILDGMESIRKNHTKLLMDNNIVPIEPTEEQFDPHLHEAIETMMDTGRNDNTIVRVDTSGYMLDGKVLRPARVIVSKGGPPWPKKASPEHDKKKRKEDGYDEDSTKEIDELEELEELVDAGEE